MARPEVWNKKRCQREHARNRAHARYGIAWNKNKLHSVTDQIQNQSASFVEKQSGRVSVFDVIVDNVVCRIVFDKQRQEVVTFLPITEETPSEWLAKNHAGEINTA